MDKVSIVIPVYNTDSQILKKCIDSALCQNYGDVEIILVDDGSTKQDTQIMCGKLASDYHNIKHIRQNNSGPCAARGAGIRRAEGKYLLFLDSDDALAEDACSHLVKVMSQYQCDIVEAVASEAMDNEIRTIDAAEYQVKVYEGTQSLLNELGLGCDTPLSWSLWGKLYKTDIMQKSYQEYPHLLRGEDVLTLAEYIEYSVKLVYSDKCVYYYNKGTAQSITRGERAGYDFSLCIVWRKMIDIYRGYHIPEALEHIKANYCTSLFAVMIQCIYENTPDAKRHSAELKKEMRHWGREYLCNKHISRRFRCLIALVCPNIFIVAKTLRKIKGDK